MNYSSYHDGSGDGGGGNTAEEQQRQLLEHPIAAKAVEEWGYAPEAVAGAMRLYVDERGRGDPTFPLSPPSSANLKPRNTRKPDQVSGRRGKG